MTERSIARRAISEQEIVRRMTPTDLRNALDIINFLATTGEIRLEDAGSLMASAEPIMSKLQKESQVLRQQQEEQRINRREFLKRAGWIGTAVFSTLAVGGGTYSCIDNTWGGAAQDKQRAIYKKLEDQDTLGTTQSLSSYLGWTVRYASRADGNFVPVGILSDPIDPGAQIQLPSNKPNKLDGTGIMIKDHIRSTDGHPVGKLAIVTKYIPATSNSSSDTIVFVQEKVLRDQPTEDINTNIVVLENPATGQKSYLSITRSQAVNSGRSYFQLRAYQPQSK